MRFFVCAGSFFYRAVLVFVLLLWLDVNICDGCIFSNIYFSVNRILYKRPVMLSEKGCQKSKRDVVASASDKVVLGGRVYLLKLFNGRQEDLVQCLQYCARIGEKMPICYFANMYSCVENVDTSTHGFSIWLKSLISTSASDDDYFHWWIHETSGYQEATIPLKRFLSSSECISLTRWNFFDTRQPISSATSTFGTVLTSTFLFDGGIIAQNNSVSKAGFSGYNDSKFRSGMHLSIPNVCTRCLAQSRRDAEIKT